jgi:putative transposase
LPVSKKKLLIDNSEERLSISRQCELLGISRSSWYYEPKQTDEETLKIMNEIDRIYLKFPYYGRRKMSRALKRLGITIGERHTSRLMEEMGISAQYTKPNLSYNGRVHIRYPYLLEELAIVKPNQVWGTDITYVKVLGGFMYLVAVLDWYSRYVVSWELSNTLTADFCIEAVKRALKIQKPEIINSDQGVQFTSEQYIGLLQEHGIQISMDHRGRCFDNIFVERLWRNVKYEEIYRHEYESVLHLRHSLQIYFQRYNDERLHESLAYQTPKEVYFR